MLRGMKHETSWFLSRLGAAFGAACSLLVPALADAQSPPCRPCAGVRVADPAAAAAMLAAAPRLGSEQRLYVAWSVELDGTAKPSEIAIVRAAGGTPWVEARFRVPAPVTAHPEALERQLRDLARLAGVAGKGVHFQIAWIPAQGTFDPVEYAFLVKRAAVAVTGAGSDARVITAALDPDPAGLRAFYAEEVAAYVDGVALAPAPAERLAAAVAVLTELDPGKPVAVDTRPWPDPGAAVLARAAADAAAGAAVTFFRHARPGAADMAPLKLLASELAGDLAYDPYTIPTGAGRAWTFVRGADLALRVIAEAPPGTERLELYFDDPQLKSPRAVDAASGAELSTFGQRRTGRGLVVPVEEPPPVVLLSLERMSAAELAGVEERVEVADERQMPVEEILRRLQAFEDDQARRLDHFQAHNTMQLRFQLGSGIETVEAAYAGELFFRRGEGFDWAWEDFYINGVKWRGKRLPEIPLIQPEKAAALPLEIHFSKEYHYRLRGTAAVAGRDCWVVDFEPLEVVKGRGLYQGTVWVDREVYARVQVRALQLGLEGDVISNEETTTYTPLTVDGQPAPWSRQSYVLPTRIVGKQLLSLLNSATHLELETLLSEIRINAPGFDQNLAAKHDSEVTMVRDTEQGLRYLEKDEDGRRVVQEKLDADRLFAAFGAFYDDSVDFPIPLAGINYLSLDFRGTGNQVNVLFAGALLTANWANPRLGSSRWDAGANLFGFFIPTSDEVYRAGTEVPEEEVEGTNARVALFLGRSFGQYTKLDLTYAANHRTFDETDNTSPDFVLPQDTLIHSFESELTYTRSGWRFRLGGSYSRRDDWEFWGLPGNADFDPEQEDYLRWQVSLAKTWWLPKFTKLGLELEHLDGSDLDRFSKYDFGLFGDAGVAGYQNGLVPAEEADGLHLTYGLNLGDVFRVELIGDAVRASDEATALDSELLAGIGLEGTVMGPWRTIVNFEVGVPVAGPGDGFAGRIIFLKLLGSPNRKRNRGLEQ